MATEFIIKKGRSTVLFDENGTCRIASDKLIENGWYLTTDTAEVYVALRSVPNDLTSPLTLRKLNECNTDIDFPDVESFESRLEILEAEEKLHTYGYREGFPSTGIDGHMYIAADEQKTNIWFNNEYLVVGEKGGSYEEPEVIFGGTAD